MYWNINSEGWSGREALGTLMWIQSSSQKFFLFLEKGDKFPEKSMMKINYEMEPFFFFLVSYSNFEAFFKIYFYWSFSYYIFLFPSNLISLLVCFSKIFESSLKTINSNILVNILKLFLKNSTKFYSFLEKFSFDFTPIVSILCSKFFTSCFWILRYPRANHDSIPG